MSTSISSPSRCARRWPTGRSPSSGSARCSPTSFPDVPANALAHLSRVAQPLAQLPPRGCWKRSGGVVYQYVDTWLGRPLADPDPAAIVRRYLAAYGPASAADVTAWSGVPGIPAVFASMDDLVRHTDAAGKQLFDLPEGRLVDADLPAPVRLLGVYDNVWLSHAGRDRVTEPAKRQRWMGVNGGLCQHGLRRRLARGPVAGRGRPPGGGGAVPVAVAPRAGRARRGARPRRRAADALAGPDVTFWRPPTGPPQSGFLAPRRVTTRPATGRPS